MGEKNNASAYVRDALFKRDGDNRARTCDLLHVKQTLSQLSYISMRRL